jgi:molybdate transport system ATP-binding protein
MAPPVTGIGITCHRAGLVLGGRRVLAPIELQIPAGSGLVLLGPNGAGKTQLLKLLGGERWPTPTDEGDEQRDYCDATGQPLDTVEVLSKVAFIGGEWQDKYYRYDWNFTVQRVVATGVHNTARPLARLKPAERARVRQLMLQFDLQHLARRQFLTLSYGEKRRALIARALAMNPGLILLDEVHNGLDSTTRTLLDTALEAARREGVTVVLAAHRADDVPAGFERALVVEAGCITYDGPLLDAPRHWLAVGGQAAVPSLAERRVTPSHAQPLLVLENVSVYRDYRPVVTDFSWTIGAGEHWAIVGANGSGKSTLLQAIYGLLPFAAAGTIIRRGYQTGEHIEQWRRRIGYVSPELQMEYLDDLSAEDFVVSGERLSFGLMGRATVAERRRARAALRLVGFAARADSAIRQLSYGQKRLALFARAMVLNPEALLLDEPLTGLDAPYRAEVKGFLSAAAQAGIQLLFATHHRTDLVPEVTRFLEIRGGKACPVQRKDVAIHGLAKHSQRRRIRWPKN